jgi:hypothetical protein
MWQRCHRGSQWWSYLLCSLQPNSRAPVNYPLNSVLFTPYCLHRVRSSTLGLLHLSAWFTTLQVCDSTMSSTVLVSACLLRCGRLLSLRLWLSALCTTLYRVICNNALASSFGIVLSVGIFRADSCHCRACYLIIIPSPDFAGNRVHHGDHLRHA